MSTSEIPTVKQIFETIREIAGRETCNDFSAAKNTTNLIEEMGADSVDFIAIVEQLERKFKIRLNQQELGQMQTLDGFKPVLALGDIVETFAQKLDVTMTDAERKEYGNPDRPLAGAIVGEIKTTDKLEIEGRK